jgi:hypothetical protein
VTDLRSLTILGLMGRLLGEIDRGNVLPPSEVRTAVANGTILDLLKEQYGDFPEFSPIHKAESALLRTELRTVMEAVDGRESFKLGLEKNGLCFLLAYCIEMLMHRNLKEILR